MLIIFKKKQEKGKKQKSKENPTKRGTYKTRNLQKNQRRNKTGKPNKPEHE
jgi:type IV secretory pathway VirD2 relaxase